MKALPGRPVLSAFAFLAIGLAAGSLVFWPTGLATPSSSAAGSGGAGARHAGRGASGTGGGTRPTAQPAPTSDPLGPDAAAYLSTRTGTVLAAVTDLRTGHTWTIGRTGPQATASIVKVDILEALLAARPTGGLPTAAEATLASKMIEISTDTAATDLWDAVGGAPAIGSYDAADGLTGTTPTAAWGLTTTTPEDQLRLVRTLVTANPHLSAAQRAYVLGFMENLTPGQRWGVSGGVPTGVTVALKDGWVPLTTTGTDWQVNSIGWVSGDDRDYVIAVLTTGNPTMDYGIGTIDGLSSLVWQALVPQGRGR